jgi:UrcA family protein
MRPHRTQVIERNIMRPSHLAVSAFLFFCIPAFSFAPAAQAEEYTVRIPASAYLLDSEQSVAMLRARIVRAARTVCLQANISPVSMSALQRCTAETATQAIVESRIPKLMAYHIAATRAEASRRADAAE